MPRRGHVPPDAPGSQAAVPLGRWSTWLGLAGALLLFLAAVRLLSVATESYAHAIEGPLRQVIDGDASALGASWLASYGLLNGSAVAAIGLSFHAAGLLDPTEAFLMLGGSRLGASGVVVLVGGLEFLQHRRYGFRHAVGLGLLAFLVSHAVYVPTTALGYLLLSTTGVGEALAERLHPPVSHLAGGPGPSEALLDVMGPGLMVLVAIVLVVVSLRLFDRLLDHLDPQALHDRVLVRLDDRWVSLGVGALATALSTSVAFSLGILVPLYNRGHVTRREMVPYILGANVATLSDTFLVAIVLGSPTSMAMLLLLAGLAVAVTSLALVAYRPWLASLERLEALITRSRAHTIAFLASLLVGPGLLLLPSLLGWTVP